MEERRRGRPSKPDAEKRQQIGVRVSPELKARLEDASDRNGRSVAQEAELRLLQSFDQEGRLGDAETQRLLLALADEIALIEKATGKHWHRDLKTWAAVAEGLRRGPIRRLRPDRPDDDEIVGEAWSAIEAVRDRKRPIIDGLAEYGITEPLTPPDRPTEATNALAAYFEPRWGAQVQIKANPEISEETRIGLLAAVDELKALDSEERQALSVWRAAMQPYWDAANEGAAWYTRLQRRRAEEAMKDGDYSAWADYVGP